MSTLTSRWTDLRYHPEQHRLWFHPARFNVNPAGRRSGKTELAKRKVVTCALSGTSFEDPRFFAAAPTRDQAKRIYWEDLKRLSPSWALSHQPSESELIIYFRNGSSIHVLGMDKPERIEGTPWDGGILDEFGNMKKQTWGQHVRPALSDRKGWCDLIGVPEGRNHYYDLAKEAQADITGEWKYFHWISADILPPSEIEAAKHDLDELTYQQEYEACHDPNTLVRLWNGNYKKIKEVVEGDILISWQNEILVPCIVLRSGKTGRRKMMTVVLEDGTSFTASNCHKMKIDNNKIELQDCQYLEKIPLYYHPKTKDQALAAVIGFNLGDGWISSKNLCAGFFSEDRMALVDLVRDLRLAEIDHKSNIRPTKNGWQIQIGDKQNVSKLINAGAIVGHKPSQDFGIPRWIIDHADLEVKKCFLAALFGCEGRTPSPGKSGKSPIMVNIAMSSKRLVFECSQMIEQFFNLSVTYVDKDKYSRAYIHRDFLNKIGFLYCRSKQEISWLWQHYENSMKQKNNQLRDLRKGGKTWKEIGEIVGLKMSTARVRGLSKSRRISNFFDKFDKWVDDHYFMGRLWLRIVDRLLEKDKDCYNILVNSIDHSYILNNEINNFNSFVNFQGRAYYPYQDLTHNARIAYDPDQPLIICLDFNVAPGVAAIIQEKQLHDLKTNAVMIGETVSGVIGQVYIPRNSNTPMVCKKLIADWGEHRGDVYIYGDATGGAQKTSATAGSDWDLVRQILKPHFGDRLHFEIPQGNPSERDRVNSVNSRLRTMDGKIRLMVDPNKAPRVVKDFEGVQCVEGGSGEIDKKKTPDLTHLSDAIGYYIHKKFPVRRITAGMVSVRGL